MKRLFFVLLFFVPAVCTAQIMYELTKVKLPECIHESSGLVIQNDTLITHNDGGSRPFLYRLTRQGVLIDSIYIKGTYNFDWEDISYNNHKFYIAETGNNLHTRKDLTIYTLDKNALLTRTTRFWYARQKGFPPVESNRDFDCEALLVLNDTAHIFTKTWSKPYTGISYHYVFPITTDSVLSLHPVDSFATGKTNFLEGSVTACDLSPGRKYFILTSCAYLYVFFDFEKNNFLQGKYAEFKFESTSQKEAVVFETDSTFYVTDERWANMVGGHLYSFNIAPFLDGRIPYSVPEITSVKTKRDGKYAFTVEMEIEIESDTLIAYVNYPNGTELLSTEMTRLKGKMFSCGLPNLSTNEFQIQIFDKKRLVYSARFYNIR